MRFLLGVLMLWGAVAALVFSDRLPLPKGILYGGGLTYFILRRAKDDASFQKWRNRLQRWWERHKLGYKLGWQSVFSRRQGNEKYAVVCKSLTEEQIRGWISDEMQKGMAQYGLDIDYRFLTEAEEIEERAKSLVIFLAESERIFFFLKLAWMPKSFQQGYITGGIRRTMEAMMGNYGDVLAQEFMDGSLGVQGDSCVFYPRSIKEQWMNVDLNRTYSPEMVTRNIARHEIRHCAQFQAIRKKGGSALVERVIRRKMKTFFGMDVLEYDAYQCQFGEERSLDKFLQEAMIEVG